MANLDEECSINNGNLKKNLADPLKLKSSNVGLIKSDSDSEDRKRQIEKEEVG